MAKRELTWVLQDNAIGHADLVALTNCIRDLNHRVELLRVIPFIHEPADPLPVMDGPCVVYGSSGLVKLGHRENWRPCGWDGETFELDFVNRSLGGFALNSDAQKTTWSSTFETAMENDWKKVFVRPVSETKEFPGRVFQVEQLREWVKQLKTSGYFEERDNDAMVGPALRLGREWRVFVVDGKQISGCKYADQGMPNSQPELPIDVANFVDEALSTFTPAKCFVVDVAEVIECSRRILKVVEFNSINSAGFYDCDRRKIVRSVSNFALNAFDD